MKSQLPLEVLGLVGPILCWIEGSERVELPETWMGPKFGIDERIDAWLVQELPNYSRDNIAEIRWLARESSHRSEEEDLVAMRTRTPRMPLGDARGVRLSPPQGYDLSDVFDRLGERYFEWSGNELSIRWRMVEELHELALRFPVRHLIRYRHARAVASRVVKLDRALELPEQLSRLHSTSQGIRAVVERGLAEGHVHLWGVMSADEVWADHVLRRLSLKNLERFPEHEQRLILLSRMASRLVALAVVYAVLGRRSMDELRPILEMIDRMYGTHDPREVREIQLAARRCFTTRLRELPRFMTDVSSERRRREIDLLFPLIDPAATLVWERRRDRGRPSRPASRRGPLGVRRLMRLIENLHLAVQGQLLKLRTERTAYTPDSDRARSAESRHRFLHEAFYRYLVLNTHYWQLATQSGRTTGLREFQRFYDAEQRRLLTDDVEVQGLVFERLRYSLSLKTVEGRVRPPDGPGELVPWILAYAEAAEHGEMKKFGLVINFLKAMSDEGAPQLREKWRFDPLRHAPVRRLTRARAVELFRLLSTPHPAVPFIVGIDAANLELTTPPEVFAPAFHFLREYPIPLRGASRYRHEIGAYSDIASLTDDRRFGLTFHVGEDFRHLLSGLRAIDEVIRYLDPRPGDRLGHAIALAVDPEAWAAKIGFQAVLPRQEALDTAVWLQHLLGSGHPLSVELSLEDRIYQWSRSIYEELLREDKEVDLSPQTLYESWRLRHLDPWFLDADELQKGHGEPRGLRHEEGEFKRWNRVQEQLLDEARRRFGSGAAYKLLYHYWYGHRARLEGSKIQPLDMLPDRTAWLAVCREVQATLRKIVQQRQLVVEVNPSSNRVVGPIATFAEHHIFPLTLDEEGNLLREIRVTVNTDDPGVFNTSLAHEYYLLAEILVNYYGKSEPETVEWLEWLRKNGNDYSFVRTLPDLKDPRMKRLLEALDRSYPILPGRLKGEPRRLQVRQSEEDRARAWGG